MKRKQLVMLLHILQDQLLCKDSDWCDAADLEQIRFDLQTTLEKRDLHDFLRHMEESMPDADDPDAWDDFYNKRFRISFDNKTIELPMYADVYEGIFGTVEQFIEDEYTDGTNIAKAIRLYRSLLFVRTYTERLKELEAMDDIDLDAHHYNLHGLKDKMYEIIDDLVDYFKYQGGYNNG